MMPKRIKLERSAVDFDNLRYLPLLSASLAKRPAGMTLLGAHVDIRARYKRRRLHERRLSRVRASLCASGSLGGCK